MTAMQEQQESEVGVIPEGWSIASLGDLGRCIRGVSYKPEHLMQETGEGVTTLLRSNNIKNDRVNFDDVQFVAGCKISEDQLARPFDIAICMSNGSKALVGKSGVVTTAHLARHPRLTVGAFCAIYRSPVQYTAQIFKSQFFQSSIDVQLAGSAINNLKGSDIEGIRFPLPPLEEQQKIAAILTAVDDKLDVIARQIEATQTLKQGLMQTLFSRGVGTQNADGRWVPHAEFKDSELGEIPATWVPTTLGAVCDGALQTGPFGSQLHADEYQDEGVPVLMPKDLVGCRARVATAARISSTRAEGLSKHKVFVGDLLFSRRGDVTRFALIDEKSEGALCGTGCLKARPSAAHSSAFLAQLLQLDVVRAWLEQNAVGQTMPNMNTGILSSLPLVVPVDRREQDEIARILDSIDSKLQVLAVKQSHFAKLKRGLMQKLLTGEWRVSVDTSATGT